MKIGFTGASSFTGYWIIQELLKAGHEVFAFLQSDPTQYHGVRKERVRDVENMSACYFQAGFGTPQFIKILQQIPSIDIFCHHASDLTNYKSIDFDLHHAVQRNTLNVKEALSQLKNKGCETLILTGTIFEENEGISEQARAVSPYGLSKAITSSIFQFYCQHYQINFKKFVITNPFGPHEEARFTRYMIENWLIKKISEIKTPLYFRDNIHVSLLAKAYCSFIEDDTCSQFGNRLCPQGYMETMGDFGLRCANEFRKRVDLPCDLHFHNQNEFLEPKIRTGTDKLDVIQLEWNEKDAWDNYVEYYLKKEAELCLQK